jgi:predicted amidohydrolase YtcJ
MHAALILKNAKITTMAPDGPDAIEAEAIACRDGRFVAVGSEADVMAHAGPGTRIVGHRLHA